MSDRPQRIDEPQNRRSQRTRAAILDSVWRLLEEVGAEGTTMTAVAERAGVSRQALYLHFASRSDLLLALHGHVDDILDLASSLQRVIDAEDSVSALGEFATHLANYHTKLLPLDLALARAGSRDPDVAALVEQGTQIWHAGCLQMARWLEDEGRLAPPWTVETAADLLWSFMFPETLHRLTVERGWSPDTFGDLLAVLLRRTLTTSPSDQT